ncbi:hypothetical protein SBRCBS47491_004045 [Sporothrix bragantina]|uniref:Major facilitator superfamily (MFS) profile domain-containing protein n=1 Tax=Sporothrix bragantina TaxID=671064 RepID=A0ABP0BLH8_9PEZI
MAEEVPNKMAVAEVENSQVDAVTIDAEKDLSKLAAAAAGHGDVALALFNTIGEIGEEIDPEEEKRLVRKIDRLLLPLCAISYIFFFIDKTTLSYAAVFGIQADLDMHGTDYSWLSSLFYFGFLVWALPANLLLQRLPVGMYLGINIMLWGILLMAQAACNNFASLAALRVLGGAVEAVADPAFILITSMWYTRREQPVKIGLWYTAVGLGIACGGLLGYGIGQIRGRLASWRYEFLIIGACCTAWGLVICLVLPNNPVAKPTPTSRWLFRLTDRERRLAVERLRDNQTGIENKTFKPRQMLEAVLDYKTYFFFMIAFCQAILNGGTTNFGTLIIKGFGFDTLETTLMQIPYGVFIFLCILLGVYVNDRLPPNNRCFVMAAFIVPTLVGAFGLRFVPDDRRVGRLICYYLTGSLNASFVLLLSLQTANIAGHTKKVTTSALLFVGYCAGNIAGPFFYKTSQAPTYPLGIWSMIVVLIIEIGVVIALRFLLSTENKRRDRVQGIDQTHQPERRDLDATAFEDMTDKENLNFRYIY